MKQNSLYVAALTVLLVLLVSCTPKATPAPARTPTPVQGSAPSASTPVAPTVSSEDAAWANIVKAAQKEGRLTIYAFSFIGDIGTGLQSEFKKKYGITVDIITGPSAGSNERIKTEQRMGNVTADMFEGAPVQHMDLNASGALASLKGVPVLREKGVWKIDPPVLDDVSDPHPLVHRFASQPPYINTDLIKKGQEPKSWKELIEPQWKGKISVADPRLTASLYTSLIGLQLHNAVSMDFIKTLGNQELKIVTSQRDVAVDLAQGKIPLGFGPSETDTFPFLQQGAHMKAINMAEGNSVALASVSAIKNGPHPNAAKVFANWILTQQGQTFYSKLAGLASVRLDSGDFRHEGARTTAKLVPLVGDDYTKLNKLFQDKYLLDLWKK